MPNEEARAHHQSGDRIRGAGNAKHRLEITGAKPRNAATKFVGHAEIAQPIVSPSRQLPDSRLRGVRDQVFERYGPGDDAMCVWRRRRQPQKWSTEQSGTAKDTFHEHIEIQWAARQSTNAHADTAIAIGAAAGHPDKYLQHTGNDTDDIGKTPTAPPSNAHRRFRFLREQRFGHCQRYHHVAAGRLQ